MKIILSIGLSALVTLMGCSSPPEDYSLDPGIPRLETPTEQIAYVRTKWRNEKHVETAFFDRQDRLLEVFRFGRSSGKTLNQYAGLVNTTTIGYYHSDSSPMGYVNVDTLRRTYNAAGRLIVEARTFGVIDKNTDQVPKDGYYQRYLDYTSRGDTIIKKVESSYDTTNTSAVANIERWERDEKKRLKRHYRLYVMKKPDRRNDTINHFSQRFAYNSSGKLALAWFDYMHLGKFYLPAGPDTIWYRYDSQNRLVEEKHVYTTDMRNKSEPDTVALSNSEDETDDFYRKKFFVGEKYSPNNNAINTIKYEYEAFDPTRHLPLKIPIR